MGKKSRRRQKRPQPSSATPHPETHPEPGAQQASVRSPEQRAEQVTALKRSLLDNYQLDERIPAIAQLHAVMDEYQRTGHSASGSLPLPGSNKRIEYVFSTRPTIPCRVDLRCVP